MYVVFPIFWEIDSPFLNNIFLVALSYISFVAFISNVVEFNVTSFPVFKSFLINLIYVSNCSLFTTKCFVFFAISLISDSSSVIENVKSTAVS